jgi:hypothetical protein
VSFELTPKQQEVADNLLAGPALHDLIYGGSRSTKTFLFCWALASRALAAPDSRHLITRLHRVDCKQKVMLDTWPRMLRLAYPELRAGRDYTLNKSDQYVVFHKPESEVWFGGLDESDKILGAEYATIFANECSQNSYSSIQDMRSRLAQNVKRWDGSRLPLKAYYDLNPVGKLHWTYQEFHLKQSPVNAMPLARPQEYAYAVMNPRDNPHLPPEYITTILEALPERQRIRFLEGKYQTEIPGALWLDDVIDELRVAEAPDLTRIVVAIDPSGSDGTGGDSQGIVAAGLGTDGHGYVLKDHSCRMPPGGWARRVVDLYSHLQADLIVAEINYGGAMVESTIRTADPNVPVKVVTASRGKHIRAEPVAALYEQQKVHHVGRFPELEEQMGMTTTAGFQGSGSPDRMDALVWALTELMVGDREPGIIDFYRKQAEKMKAQQAQTNVRSSP